MSLIFFPGATCVAASACGASNPAKIAITPAMTSASAIVGSAMIAVRRHALRRARARRAAAARRADAVRRAAALPRVRDGGRRERAGADRAMPGIVSPAPGRRLRAPARRRLRPRLSSGHVDLLAFLDQRAHPIGLPPARQMPRKPVDDLVDAR